MWDLGFRVCFGWPLLGPRFYLVHGSRFSEKSKLTLFRVTIIWLQGDLVGIRSSLGFFS